MPALIPSWAMLKVDFYVQRIARHSATGVEMVSGQPIVFKFADGDRETKQPIEHALLVELVQECATPIALEALRTSGRAQFVHSSSEGIDVQLLVDAQQPNSWRVRMTPLA